MAVTVMGMVSDLQNKVPVIRVTGLVEKPGEWAMEDLAGLSEQVSEGEIPGRGVSAGALLEASGPRGGYVSVESDDGAYRASIPLGELSSKGVVVYGLGDDRLPPEHGGPFRILVPEGRTLCWNVKGVGEMRVTAQPEPDSVPANPTH
ncbi:MAG: molybdopterin-dependent oxidoreductase [bacterium]|nr:molybdopterin-dependent oxidoreductase [bacterium]